MDYQRLKWASRKVAIPFLVGIGVAAGIVAFVLFAVYIIDSDVIRFVVMMAVLWIALFAWAVGMMYNTGTIGSEED